MFFNHGIGCGKSQTGAGLFGRVIRVKDAGDYFIGDTDSFIRDRYLNIVTGGKGWEFSDMSKFPGGNRKFSAVRH